MYYYNLFKMRLDNYNEVINFCHQLSSAFDSEDKIIKIIEKQLTERKPRFDVYYIGGSKKFLAQVEYLFGNKLANYIKDKYEIGEVHTLGKINRESNKFELNSELESMFAPHFKP